MYMQRQSTCTRKCSRKCSSHRVAVMARLFVEGTNGRVEVQVDLTSDTVRSLKKLVEELEGTPSTKQLLRCANGVALCDNDALLSSYELEEASIRLSIIPDNHFIVAVENVSETTLHFVVEMFDTVLSLKRMIEGEKGHSPRKQRILHRGREVDDDAVVSNLPSVGGGNRMVVVNFELRHHITIHLHNGETLEMDVASNEPVETLEAAVYRRGRVPYHHHELVYNDQLLEVGHRISEYQVSDGSHINVRLRDYETMVFIKTLTGRTIMVMVGPNDTVAQVKSKIERQEEIPAHHQRLIFVGEQLNDQHRLLDYRIEHESTVHLVLRAGDTYDVFVEVPDGHSHPFEVLPTDSLSYLKNKLRERVAVPLDLIEVYHNDQKLDDDAATMREMGVVHGSSLRMVIDQGRDTQIFVGLPNRDTLSLWVNTEMTVAELKDTIAQRGDIPSELQLIYFARQQLQNERTLRSYTIESNHMLHVDIIRPPVWSLTVQFPDERQEQIQLAANKTVRILKREIETKTSIPYEEQQLFFQGSELDNGSQLQNCGLSDGSVVDLSTSRRAVSAGDGVTGQMHLFIKTLSGKTVSVVVTSSDTVLDIKRKIMDKEGVALAHQCLICGGKQLDDDLAIQDSGVQHQSIIHLVLRVPSQGPISLSVQRGDTNFTVDAVSASETVAQLKAKLEPIVDIPAQELQLSFRETELMDENTLESYNINSQSTLIINN